jgi:hypothetical protein
MYTSNSSSNSLPVRNTMTTTTKTKAPTTATNNNNEKHNNKGNSRRKGIFLLGIIVGIVITETHRNLSSMNIIDICGSARNALPSSGSLITVDDDRDQDGSSSSSSSNRVDTNNNKEIIKKQKRKQKRKQKLQQKLPLKPPFYIIQYGPSRTASTFQSQLLSIIVGLKSKQSITMDQKLQHTFAMSSIAAGRKRDKKYGFVLKTHNQGQVYKTIDAFQQKFGITVSVFMSSNEISMNENESMISNSTTKINVLHDQTFANMSNCSLCEINNYYKPIFDLSNDDVTLLEEYMKNWEILRQCCGIQQSKYNRYRLHGCNMTQLYKEKPTNNYPYCENYNLPDIENNIVSMSKDIVYRHPNDNDNNGKLWSKPGDCKRIDQIIINGGEMNKVYKFKTCDTYFDQKQFQKYN